MVVAASSDDSRGGGRTVELLEAAFQAVWTAMLEAGSARLGSLKKLIVEVDGAHVSNEALDRLVELYELLFLIRVRSRSRSRQVAALGDELARTGGETEAAYRRSLVLWSAARR